jgi:hypothetical protein
MSDMATTTETQEAPSNRDEAERILSEAKDALAEIEIKVDEINGLMVELLFSGGLSEEAQVLANDLGAEANELFNDLSGRVEALRKEIADNDDDNDDDGGEAA